MNNLNERIQKLQDIYMIPEKRAEDYLRHMEFFEWVSKSSDKSPAQVSKEFHERKNVLVKTLKGGFENELTEADGTYVVDISVPDANRLAQNGGFNGEWLAEDGYTSLGKHIEFIYNMGFAEQSNKVLTLNGDIYRMGGIPFRDIIRDNTSAKESRAISYLPKTSFRNAHPEAVRFLKDDEIHRRLNGELKDESVQLRLAMNEFYDSQQQGMGFPEFVFKVQSSINYIRMGIGNLKNDRIKEDMEKNLKKLEYVREFSLDNQDDLKDLRGDDFFNQHYS